MERYISVPQEQPLQMSSLRFCSYSCMVQRERERERERKREHEMKLMIMLINLQLLKD